MGDLERSPEFDQQNDDISNENHDAEHPPKKSGSKEKGRKRTKSGCLTCRKRRIKCGEERPTCQNCTKSKRQCEGYNQRVVFKDPLSAYRPSWAGTSQMSFSGRGGPRSNGIAISQQAQISVNPPPIAPKPVGYSTQTDTSVQDQFSQATSANTEQHQVYVFSDQTSVHQQSNIPPRSQNASTTQFPETLPGNTSHAQIPHYDFNTLTKLDTGKPPAASSVQLSPLDWSTIQSSVPQQFANEVYYDPARQFAAHSTDPIFPQQHPPKTEWPLQNPPPESLQPCAQDFSQAPMQRHVEAKVYVREPAPVPATLLKAKPQDSMYQPDLMEDDDDPFDISDSDEDMLIEDDSSTKIFLDPQDQHLRNNDLGIVVALQASHDNQGLRMRSVRDFIDRPDMLAGYAPSFQSSPFRDPMTARLFCHFVNVTAPIISMFERHPANPSLIFQGQPIPKSQQHIWTYVFPTLALQNPALLHAMLALASLHVSQLQNVPPTKSLKHYHISLRRVAKCLSLPSQRAKPATLAAAMLLSFYECWCADHQKWSNHLLGARHLLSQIEFAKVAKHIKLTKEKEREQERTRNFETRRQHGSTFIDDKTRFQSYVEDVDENLVGMLLGIKVRYDQYGQILEDLEQEEYENTVYSEKDIEVYELQRDVYWWYAKQDVYQSLLGGGRLFLQYDLWSRCPPRAPIGRLNATYGTYDHLILLVARVANFASKDLIRKRRAVKANGGWRPPQSMGGPPPGAPQGMSGHPPGMGPPGKFGLPGIAGGPPRGPLGMPQMPPFSGMVPTSGQVHLPMGFEEYSVPSPESTTSGEYDDLDSQRLDAEDEWQEIRNMFAVLADHFGEDFQPLGPEFSSPIQTPFGPAHQYRTYGIAGIWMNYYMGLIACHRAHPDMPPAAMMAAGFAARQTASMANELGRVAAGIAPDCSMTTQVSPGVGAGLIESATCLFIAGVQYQDAGQRLWTINRLSDISRLTGWQTARAIATGCETSWVKTAEAGQGPPYTRVTEERVQKDIWANGRRVDRATADRDENNQLIVSKTDRVFYALGVLGLEHDFENLDVEDQVKPSSPSPPPVKNEALDPGYKQYR